LLERIGKFPSIPKCGAKTKQIKIHDRHEAYRLFPDYYLINGWKCLRIYFFCSDKDEAE